MKITTDRVKEIIKEEYQKIQEQEELDVMVRGYGNLGTDPMIALSSAKRNLDNYLKGNVYDFESPFQTIDNMASGEEPIDTNKLEMAVDMLRPLSDDNEIELAIAKLSAVLEQRMKINEVKDEKKRSKKNH